MKFDENYLKYEFLNHEITRNAYITLKNDNNPLCKLFKVYKSVILIGKYYICIGKYERFTEQEVTLEYIFLELYENKCKNIITIAEFDLHNIEETNLYLDDIYQMIEFSYSEDFYDAIDFNINMFF